MKLQIFEDSLKRGWINYRYYQANEELKNDVVVFCGSYVDEIYRGQNIFKLMLFHFLLSLPEGILIQIPISNEHLLSLFNRLNFKKIESMIYWGELENCYMIENKLDEKLINKIKQELNQIES